MTTSLVKTRIKEGNWFGRLVTLTLKTGRIIREIRNTSPILSKKWIDLCPKKGAVKISPPTRKTIARKSLKLLIMRLYVCSTFCILYRAV